MYNLVTESIVAIFCLYRYLRTNDCTCSCLLFIQVAKGNRRKDMHQIWFLIAELIDEHKTDEDDSSQTDSDKSFKKPYAQLPFGRSMISTM